MSWEGGAAAGSLGAQPGLAPMATGKSAFLQKFQSKISVVAKDGSMQRTGGGGELTRPAPDHREQLDADRPWRTFDAPPIKKSKSKPEIRRHSPDDEGGYASGGRAAGARNRSGGGGSYARPVETEFSSNAERLAYSKKGRPVEYRCVHMCTRVRASGGTRRRDADRAC